MYILGINRQHNASAALLEDGNVVAAVEEERLNRQKYYSGFPERSIEYCLDEAGIDRTDLDHVALFWDWRKIVKRPWQLRPFVPRNVTRPHRIAYHFATNIKTYIWDFKQFARRCEAEGHFVDHHLCHAASAFWGSTFDRANIITLDGRGELDTGMLAVGDRDEIEVLERIPLPYSLGDLWRSVTTYLGFNLRDEGKVMGLASYGEPNYKNFFDEIVTLTGDGFNIDTPYLYNRKFVGGTNYFPDGFVKRLGPARGDEGPLAEERYADIAASLQAKTDEIACHLVDLLHEQTGYSKVVLAGGVALNCVMNGRILHHDVVDDIYVHPAAGDSGTAIGAAQVVYNETTGRRPDSVMDVGLGPGFSSQEVRDTLDRAKCSYERVDDPGAVAARALAEDKIVGWFQGRMEWGPRALGHRSILANPRVADAKQRVNEHVKRRENWRPFAPSILEEAKDDYLVDSHESPHMILAFDVKTDRQGEVPAITHVDGTTRPQTVSREFNPRYHDAISTFGDITGTPVVLNTSFNLSGEPIVCTPDEALADFFISGMDVLVLEDFVVRK